MVNRIVLCYVFIFRCTGLILILICQFSHSEISEDIYPLPANVHSNVLRVKSGLLVNMK
ncbi:hypothetical protein CI102_7613 [Trichoderma harzianum]|nr:hypothetical protein CI102_7613 [Trichoderma harzianum]